MAGLASVFGIELGNLILAVSTAAGLSAILASSVVAFNIVKYLGAAYLIYLGIRRLLSNEDHTPTVVQRKPLSHIFIQGTCVAVLNPKTALFFLAFLPQFTDVLRGGMAEAEGCLSGGPAIRFWWYLSDAWIGLCLFRF